VEVVYGITAPILSPFQRIIPQMGVMDVSPLVAFIVLFIIQQILLSVVSSAFQLSIQ
jgi:YggT family protein